MIEKIKRDLKSLYDDNYILEAEKLNQQLGDTFFNTNTEPMYFTGDFKAKTVFVMLNPGGGGENYSFKDSTKSNFKDFHSYYDHHIDARINYGKYDYERLDNFDTKQAAFLYHFKDSGVEIPEEFWKSNDLKKEAKQNVLIQKLQLELIPYNSRQFQGMLDSPKLANKNITVFQPYIEHLLDVIVQHDRKYVIFAAKQFYFLLQSYAENGFGEISFGEEKNIKLENLRNRVFYRSVKINHKNKEVNGLIPYSFPRQDLPNAYSKMAEYGKFCFETNYP